MNAPMAEAGTPMAALRHWRQDLLALFALGVIVCGLAARFIPQPGYTDAYYYFGDARQLAGGQGFTEPYLWNYLGTPRAPDPGAPLWPSHLYWMPLVSIVAAPWLAAALALAQWTGRVALTNAALFRAAQLPFILLAAALPLLTYWVTVSLGAARRPAIIAALLTLFSPFYFVFWTTTDAFALYALAGAGALVCAVQAERQPSRARWWLLATGLAVGLAHLTRADGMLLLLCLLLWVAARPAGRPGWRARLAGLACLLIGYGLVMAPWFWRDWLVSGSPLGLGGLRTAWLTNYDDLFTFTPERLTPAAYLAAGAASLLSGKWAALLTNAQTVIAVQCGIVAFPFVLVGAWRLRRHPLIQLAMLYGLALLAAMTLVFTFPGARGGYFHSGAALLPFLMPAAALGLEAAVEAVARRLPHWQPEKSKPIFGALLVAFAVLLTAAVFWQRVIGAQPTTWSASERVYGEAGAWLATQGDTGVITAANDPPGWNYWTGRPAIVIPNGDAATLRQAMQTYGARFVLLDENRPGALSALYANPNSVDVFIPRATFSGSAGQPAYLLELVPEP